MSSFDDRKEKQLELLIKDLKIAYAMENTVEQIKTVKIKSPVDELLEYSIGKCIDSMRDCLTIVKEIPEIEQKVSDVYDEYQKKRRELEAKSYAREHKWDGVYDKIEDCPGYGTEFNSRCIPSGVIIRQKPNSRC